MNEVLNYLKESGVFYLGTVDNGQARVRPFGAIAEFEGKLYIVTSKQKNVYRQMQNNPKIEITSMNKDTWIRIEAEAISDERREARVKMMEDNKDALSKMYSVDDQLMEVLYLQKATAMIYSFTAEPKVIKF